jgi:hypothetical protein
MPEHQIEDPCELREELQALIQNGEGEGMFHSDGQLDYLFCWHSGRITVFIGNKEELAHNNGLVVVLDKDLSVQSVSNMLRSPMGLIKNFIEDREKIEERIIRMVKEIIEKKAAEDLGAWTKNV